MLSFGYHRALLRATILLVLAASVAPVSGQAARRAAPAPATPSTAANSESTSGKLELSDAESAKYREAIDLFNNQDLQGALEKLRELTAGNAAARPPRVIAAQWFGQLKNPRAARIMLEAATGEDPEDPEAYLTLAEISLNEGELTAAELLAQKGAEKLAKYGANPDRKKTMESKASELKIAVSAARGRWTEVASALTAKIKSEGESAELDSALGNALFQQGKYDQARQMLDRAHKASEEKALPADAAMARLYSAQGNFDAAKTSLDAALKANPKSVPVLILSINSSLTENNLDDAWKRVQQLYQEDKSPDALKTYGRVALFRSDYKRAEAAFQEAVRQSPLDSEASNGLALALCEQGDEKKNERAVQYAAGNVQKRQNDRDFLATLGWALYRSGRQDEAIKVLQQSTADGQINAASAYYFAVVLSDKGQNDQAKKFLEAALGTKTPFAKRSEAEALLKKLQ
ncbi:MAG: tetratricopeptide repeat protein [Thermoguttaceae bacterium]|nr:tetratricopeptide repeat protein [Thermoguttaceae bacterium]